MANDTDRLANLLAAVATGLTDRIGTSVSDRTGLDETAATALVALLDFSPDGSVRKLARGLGLTHSGTVRLVDRLVEAGLVRRGPGPDQRSIRLTLTRSGRSAATRARRERAEQTLGVLAGLSDRQRRELARACEAMLANITRDRLEQRAAGRDPGGALCRLCDFAACGRPDGRCPTERVAAAAQR